MLIVICGMHRSGSTLAYQVANRLLEPRMEVRHVEHGLGGSVDEMKAMARSAETFLVKVHVPTRDFRRALPQTGARYIYTHRDVRDAIASLYRKGRANVGSDKRGPGVAGEMTRRELLAGRTFLRMPDLLVAKYEEFVGDSAVLINTVARFLGITPAPGEAEAIKEATSLDRQRERVEILAEEGRDLGTRITRFHITDGRIGAWWHTLTAAELQAIEDEAAEWMTEFGYRLALRPDADRAP